MDDSSGEKLIGRAATAPTASPDLPAGLPETPTVTESVLREQADILTAQWQMLAPTSSETAFPQRLKSLGARLVERLRACRQIATTKELTPQLELLESTRMLEAALTGAESASASLLSVPHVRVGTGEGLPRAMNLAEGYLSTAGGIWSPESLTVYVQQAQQRDPLLLEEVSLLPVVLKLAQLEFILDRADETFAAGDMPDIEHSPFSAPIHSLRRMNQFEWRTVLEPLIPFSEILRQDPCGVFSEMDEESRVAYYTRVASLASHADFSEVDTAQAALVLALQASHALDADPRLARRKSHIGYYLFAEGLPLLTERIGYHAPPMERVRRFLREWNEDFYIIGIFVVSLFLIVVLLTPLVPHHAFWPLMGTLLLALLPATQGAVDLVNSCVTSLLKANALPKLDFSKHVPESATTIVVVPTLLLSERQVRELFDELEARYLANQDPNIHFGLLTDLPDTDAHPLSEGRDPLVQLAVQITNGLNEKYAHQKGGSFLFLHRFRVFNARQGVWMGWERKRGKLLDFNKFLLREFDSFPVKAGPMQVLEHVRYVITLDSDTQLPRGTAARMVGTIAHPLNQAIVDPHLRVVKAGYGILQPRVGVSVASASRSRLAALYSGETGFDIYTRAVSDAYQDLFGEGIFAGKGIYEAAILHQMLDRRFPNNALLSHDLIEGAYVRAGLVTDIEIIDDYPSHYSAHSRRQHRWVRGDWQIARWIFNRVPDESGHTVQNPISTISRWKIFDNLRRSLIDPFTFLLLVFGWLFLPGGALYWTVATLVLLLLPALVQLGFNLGRAVVNFSELAVRDSFINFASSFGLTLLDLAFLPHQMLLSVDAILRSMIRSFISGKRLLEWETAAQAEAGRKKTSLDRYLQLSPVLALVLGLGVAAAHLRSLIPVGPVLLLWAFAPLIAKWLNSSPQPRQTPLTAADTLFLVQQAHRIWRYFSEFGGEQNHWLIPDNVEEKGTLQVRKLSPTNLGMLFNARQAAYEFGFITLPEFARATLGTLDTYERLEKMRGHIYNWYDIETLKAIPPFTISAVDSGNLAASLYTLHAGALDLLKLPLASQSTFAALEMLDGESKLPDKHDAEQSAATSASSSEATPNDARAMRALIRRLLESLATDRPQSNQNIGGPNAIASISATRMPATYEEWLVGEEAARKLAISSFVRQYTPWLLPEFEHLFELEGFSGDQDRQVPSLATAGEYARALGSRLATEAASLHEGSPLTAPIRKLRDQLEAAQKPLEQLKTDIARIADIAEQHAESMEYGFLLVASRQLLSIGYDGPTGELHSACYDLLASEARIASFLAVAKGDIPQQSWFRLDRSHVLVGGRPCLLSWTGTMFEYMMPALWMRNLPNTLISRSLEAAVNIQRDYVKDIPWGISESGFAKMDSLGRYGYQAWGIPTLALKYAAEDGPVISPYSTFLALPLLRNDAIANLRHMAGLDWVGAYGFFEAADYTQVKNAPGSHPELVRSWMAHHQGMSLLAVANLLRGSIIQRWFHSSPRVRAAELLLHEKPLSNDTLSALAKQAKLKEADSNSGNQDQHAVAST